MQIPEDFIVQSVENAHFKARRIQDSAWWGREKSLWEDIVAIIQWDKPLIPLVEGRSGYLPLVDNESESGFLKLKGLGFFDPEANKISPPGGGIFDEHKGRKGQLAYQLAVTTNGDLEYLPFPPKPYGAVVLAKAQHEFMITKLLFAQGLKVFEPTFVYQYEDLQFENENLGVVGFYSTTDLRDFVLLADLVNVELEDNTIYLSYGMMAALENQALEVTPLAIFNFLKEFFFDIGHELHQIHQVVADIELHFQNIGLNIKTNKLYFFDLDRAKLQSDLLPKQSQAYLFRDVLSFMSSWLYMYFGSSLAKYFLLEQRHFSEDFIDLMNSFLNGYSQGMWKLSGECLRDLQLEVRGDFGQILEAKNRLSFELAELFDQKFSTGTFLQDNLKILIVSQQKI